MTPTPPESASASGLSSPTSVAAQAQAAEAAASTTAVPDEQLGSALGAPSFDSGVTQTPKEPASLLRELRGRSSSRFAGAER